MDAACLFFFPTFQNHPIGWNDYLGEGKWRFSPKLSCRGGVWGAGGSLKTCVQMPHNAGSHGTLNLLIFSSFSAAFAINTIIIPWLRLWLGKVFKKAPHFKHMRIPKGINRTKKYLAAALALPEPRLWFSLCPAEHPIGIVYLNKGLKTKKLPFHFVALPHLLSQHQAAGISRFLLLVMRFGHWYTGKEGCNTTELSLHTCVKEQILTKWGGAFKITLDLSI